MTLRKREDTEYWNRKHWIALCGEFALERLWNCRKTEYWVVYGMRALKNTVIKLWVLHKVRSFDQVRNPQLLKKGLTSRLVKR